MDSQSGYSYSVDAELHATLAEMSQLENPEKNDVSQESDNPTLLVEASQHHGAISRFGFAQSWRLTIWIACAAVFLAAVLLFSI